MPTQLYVLDLDGTVYRGNEPMPGAAEAISELRLRGKQIRFVTNNSRATPSSTVAKLAAMGIGAFPEEVLSSGMAVAKCLAEKGWRRVFVVGEKGLFESLEAEGLETFNRGAESVAVPSFDGQADAVVVGICRTFTYGLMNAAMQQILGGATFLATNIDSTYPVENGRFCPGAGSIVAAVRACSGKEPLVIGKPETFMLDLILAESGCAREEILVVGDRVETDLEWGRRAGCPTHLVLTGVASEPPAGQRYSADLRGLLEG